MLLMSKIQPLWLRLNSAQRGYVVATLFVVLWILNFSSQVWPMYGMALSLLYAVSQDMWQGFLRVWHSLAGKALIIVFYAVLGNFCFAMAEAQVNNLIGIRPDVVPYTVNLTVVLLAPIWSFGLSLVVLTLYIMLHTVKIMLLLLLRPLGVRSHHLLNDEAYPVTTLLTRIIYLPVFMTCLAALPSAYLTGDSTPLEDLFHGEPTLLAVTPAGVTRTETTNPPAPTTAELTASTNDSKRHEINVGSALPTILWLNRTLAGFLYQVESLSRSSCPMTGPEHLVHINDYEVLVITPNEKAETGYQYQVRLCGSVGYRQPAPLPPQS